MISVALATYNGSSYIEQQIESILHQTKSVDEIVICDDCSTDDTISILQSYQQKYPNLFKIMQNEKQLGCAKNFEKAISNANGDIIFIADQDDVWNEDKVEKMMDLLSSSNAKGCFSDSSIVDAKLLSLGTSHLQIRGFSKGSFDSSKIKLRKYLLPLFLKRVPPAAHDMAITADAKSIILPFPNLPNCHDTWIGLCLVALDGWAFTNEELTLFRQHNNNASNSGKQGGIIAKIKQAKASIKNNTFAWNAQLYKELITRLEDKCDKDVLELLHDRMEHSLARSNMQCNIIKRLPLIVKEILNRRYFRYGRGWLNIVQDMFFRNACYK